MHPHTANASLRTVLYVFFWFLFVYSVDFGIGTTVGMYMLDFGWLCMHAGGYMQGEEKDTGTISRPTQKKLFQTRIGDIFCARLPPLSTIAWYEISRTCARKTQERGDLVAGRNQSYEAGVGVGSKVRRTYTLGVLVRPAIFFFFYRQVQHMYDSTSIPCRRGDRECTVLSPHARA